ncbi:hypothetical protein MKX83_02925 [Cytobacillus sp. FSL M8-0252]|uniref:hypothetical protein n=1 Tax=Cytobacillus sp. FSL M8-0252 TaxID=2921621 RepID=UPI0030F5FD10
MENKTVRNLVHDLDFELGEIGLRSSVLDDIQTLMYQLVTDMNDKVHLGQERHYFREWHRELRVLSELLHYTVNDLKEEYESTRKVYGTIFEKVVKQGEHYE